MNTILFSTLTVFLTTYAQFVLRIRLRDNPISGSLFSIEYILYMLSDLWILSCAGAFGLAFACWSMVIANSANVGKIYFVTTSATLLIISLLSVIVFHDKFSMINILGGALVICGIFLLLNQSVPLSIPPASTL